LLDEEILREEVAVNRPPNTSVLPYCTDVESVPNPANATETVQRFRSVAQSHLCAKLDDLLQKQKIAYTHLSPWYSADDRSLPAVLNVVSGYVLPVLMGLLGSMTYVLRRYLRSVGERLLTPRDLREYIVRLVLGTVFGVAIGFFTTSENVIANPVRLARRRWRSSPAMGLKPCSACWMDWRTNSPPRGSEVVSAAKQRPVRNGDWLRAAGTAAYAAFTPPCGSPESHRCGRARAECSPSNWRRTRAHSLRPARRNPVRR
jgi:hypothetical protein